jgi:hypothetical protein
VNGGRHDIRGLETRLNRRVERRVGHPRYVYPDEKHDRDGQVWEQDDRCEVQVVTGMRKSELCHGDRVRDEIG